MISLDKRQLVAITKFCDSSKLCGSISYLGNAIEACNGPIAIRVQLVVNGIKEEKIRIPKTALLAAIAAMDKDDVAIISADNIKVDRIHIGFEPLEQLFFEDLTPVFNSIKDGLPDRFRTKSMQPFPLLESTKKKNTEQKKKYFALVGSASSMRFKWPLLALT